MTESLLIFAVKIFGALVRFLPLGAALAIGRAIGRFVYYFDARRKEQIYANLRVAFADQKSPAEIKAIARRVFENFAQNFIDLLRLPLLTRQNYSRQVDIEGVENLAAAREKGKGVIVLAMHYGSWELASLSCAMMGLPYKVLVNPQARLNRLNELLNTYRSCKGSVVLSRGLNTRDMVTSLKNNEVIGMVVDQGGRAGVLVPFFGKKASFSAGALRLALKRDVPICFAAIMRQPGGRHRLVYHPPLEIVNTSDPEADLKANLRRVAGIMEDYIREYPQEYMWFYKIWKYTDESVITVLNDGKMGHYRQSEAIAALAKKVLLEKGVKTEAHTVDVDFKSPTHALVLSVVGSFIRFFVRKGRIGFLRRFLTEETYKELNSRKSDFVVSCGTKLAGVNYFYGYDNDAKMFIAQKPGIWDMSLFSLVVLPRHDMGRRVRRANVVTTFGALNPITPKYLEDRKQKLLLRYSHLKNRIKKNIALFIGGDSKHIFISEQQVRVVVNQLKGVLRDLGCELLVSSSRRTPAKIDQILFREFKKHPACPLLVSPNKEDIPEAVGGMLALGDIIVVSGDSISMVSEAATSGKNVIVFLPEKRVQSAHFANKHLQFLNTLHDYGHIISTDARNVGQVIYEMLQGKRQTRKLEDSANVYEALNRVI